MAFGNPQALVFSFFLKCLFLFSSPVKADSSPVYQHVHLGPSRRADRDNIDRSCSQTQINDVALEKNEVERKWTRTVRGEKKLVLNELFE